MRKGGRKECVVILREKERREVPRTKKDREREGVRGR